MNESAGLIRLICRERSSAPPPSSVGALAENLLARYGTAVQAVLFYGSCFRNGDDTDGISDLYLLVDSYRHAYRRKSRIFFNKLLPPNVFYLEIPYMERKTRAKYAVFSSHDFLRGTSGRWFHSYLWARLAQPVSLIYARNSRVEEQTYLALAQAVLTFVSRVMPLMPPRFTCRELWCRGLSLSYAAELRPERRDKPARLFEDEKSYYEQVTRAVIGLISPPVHPVGGMSDHFQQSRISAFRRVSSGHAWLLRRFQGKMLSILRLIKGFFTFEGGLNYVLWKIERHSGVTAEIDSRLRQIPIVGVCVLFWRLYRRGAFR